MNEKHEQADFSAVWRRVFGVETEPQAPSTPAEQLEGFLRGADAAARSYTALASRTCGQIRQRLLCLASEERRHFRQLETEYYLLTGDRCVFPAPSCSGGPMLETLRRQYGLELDNAQALEASAAGADGRLAALFQNLAARERRHAEQVLALLRKTM